MLITGIRQALNAELDIRRSAVFLKYLIHYLEMFALLGIILPVTIATDFYCEKQKRDEMVTNKYFQVADNLNHIEYYINTDSYHFLSDNIFFEKTNINDRIVLHCTPIFHTVTYVTNQIERDVYTCKPNNIYGWPIILVGLTFVFSFCLVIWSLFRKNENYQYNAMVNLGIINAILCLFTITATFFHIV